MIGKRKTASLAAFATASVLALSACTGTTNAATQATKGITDSESQPPTTVTVWVFNKLPAEVKAIEDAKDRLEKKYTWLTVDLVTSKDDAAFTKAVTSGQPPDVFVSPSPDNVAKFCANGTVIDMSQLAKSVNLNIEKTFPASVLTYTKYKNKQCALPLLVDSYALYYNKDMFKAAGIASPPKTLSELTEDAKKLTVRNPDGSIKVWGMSPPRSDYAQDGNIFIGGQTGAPFYDSKGKATFGTDAVWPDLLTWQKNLLNFYGEKNVESFLSTYQSHSDDAQSAFVSGKSAMEFGGEWHIGENAQNNPKLNYGVVAFPVPDAKADLYGAGSVLGNVVYIPAGSKKQAAAFLVVQQLTTDTEFLNTFASEMSNIPTTYDALNTWKEASDPHWKTFINITENKNSYYKTLTSAGSEDRDSWINFVGQWEQGKVSDLKSGLSSVAKQIDELNSQQG